MPKLGMGPIRREQIFRSAATVIAREGFPGTTMRGVAEEAGVSTGMLNHYFSNRADMLVQTLEYVSTSLQASVAEALEEEPPGEGRLRRVLSIALPRDAPTIETWRIWIAAYGEAVRSNLLRDRIEDRLEPWYDLLDRALEGFPDSDSGNGVPLSWRFDGLLNGLVLQALVSTPDMSLDQIEETLLAFVRRTGA
jgi:AcrR family transcriptional regulator